MPALRTHALHAHKHTCTTRAQTHKRMNARMHMLWTALPRIGGSPAPRRRKRKRAGGRCKLSQSTLLAGTLWAALPCIPCERRKKNRAGGRQPEEADARHAEWAYAPPSSCPIAPNRSHFKWHRPAIHRLSESPTGTGLGVSHGQRSCRRRQGEGLEVVAPAALKALQRSRYSTQAAASSRVHPNTIAATCQGITNIPNSFLHGLQHQG